MSQTWKYPDAIVTTDWLADHLDQGHLRIYDCTTYLRYEEGTGQPYRVESGQEDWKAGHIPGSVYLDLQGSFSVADAPTRFMRRKPEEVAAAFAAAGVSDDVQVILYARGSPQWATRFWWMLRWIGFDRAAILDGGWDKWAADGRPVSVSADRYPPGTLTARPREKMWVDSHEMLAAIGDVTACSLNALGHDLHSGVNARYGRPGRIPGSVNLPASSLIDPDTKVLKTPAEVAKAFDAVGAHPEKRILNYCGGGIAATLDAFLQHQLGFTDIAVYDASMSEWAKDPDLPIEVS